MATNPMAWRGADDDEPVDGRRVLARASHPAGLYEVMESPGTASPGAVCESWFSRRADGVLVYLGTSRGVTEARAMCEWDDGRGISATIKARG